MERFAFIIHPLDAKRDVARKYPIARYLPEPVVEKLMRFIKPKVVSHITGIRSPQGVEAEGWFVGVALSPKMMMADEDGAIKAIVEAGEVAEALGAKIIGLGAYTAIVGDAGISIAKNLNIAVTTGNSYTVATALEATKEAAELMGIDLKNACAAVVGATGSIGAACAQILCPDVAKLTLVGRNEDKLHSLKDRITNQESRITAEIQVQTDIAAALRDADIVITVTSALDAVIYPEHLKSGAVVCDVARPRDVSRRVVEERDDVLVIEGGIVEVPGDVDFGFDFGFPPKTCYACMAETMICALEGTYEPFTLGREITVQQVQRIQELARKHGFKLSGFRSFERAVSVEEIKSAHQNAERARRHKQVMSIEEVNSSATPAQLPPEEQNPELEAERKAFYAMLESLLTKYEGKYVAVLRGQVVAVGDDLVSTAMEAYRKCGYQTIFVEKVSREGPRVVIMEEVGVRSNGASYI